MFSKEALKQQMADMGLHSDDTVLIHTSLKAIGETENGADGIIDAFCEYLHDGLFLVPTHTWANVNKAHPYYDVRKTVPCIGALPRIAAFRPDGIRSLHPTHSMWAHGNGAEAFIAQEGDALSPAPVGFAWSRLAEANAKILLIGVNHDRNTFIHSVDEHVNLPDRIGKEPYDVTIVDHTGTVHCHPMYPHLCSKTEDVSIYYVNFEKPLIEMGAQSMGKLGNADVRIIDAKACREIIARIYTRSQKDIFTQYIEIPQNLYR